MRIQVTTREAAAALGVSLRTAQRRAQRGQLDAVKVGGRWLIALPVQLDDYKADQVEKARDLIEARAILPTSRPGVYTAVSSDGTTTYLVHASSCTCPAGQRGRKCYHRAAVSLLNAACAA